MKMTLPLTISIAATVLLLAAASAPAVDLLARYPTTLTAGDAEPGHARPWQFTADDIVRVSQFQLQIGDKFKVTTQGADLGIGHCPDGAVWAVLLPREEATLTSSAADQSEPIANVWFRFHPAQLNRLFPPETVFADGDKTLLDPIRSVVDAKFRSSWHAGMNAMIPEPKDVTVYVDTKADAHRFFMVDTDAKTAEYVAAFNRPTSSRPTITPDTVPPVVIKTIPESGSTNVPPGDYEIKVTFSKEMTDQSWSWCTVWKNSTPESGETPQYSEDHRTCVLKAKLEPGTTYGYWLNSESYRAFQDKQGHPAVPYLLVFTTQGEAPSSSR